MFGLEGTYIFQNGRNFTPKNLTATFLVIYKRPCSLFSMCAVIASTQFHKNFSHCHFISSPCQAKNIRKCLYFPTFPKFQEL